MAGENPLVHLGYIDEQICENGPQSGSLTINKIGGKFLSSSDTNLPTPLCKVCSLQAVLVTQIYAPLENSPYHRSLILYACINSSCWNKKESWICLRHQEIDPTFTVSSPTDDTKSSQNTRTGWCEQAEDWGSESEPDDENGNIGAGITSLSLSPHEEIGASSNLGATGFATSPVATAEIEGGETDVVEIDSPLGAQVNVMSLLQSSMPVPQVSSQSFQFVPFYLYFEPETSGSERPDEHISSLLAAYTQANPMDNAMSSGGGETYEKSAPEHGDKCFHRFVSRMRQNPGHVIRYCRDNSAVLWMSRPESVSSLHCVHCHSPLTFECQLLSTLITSLSLQILPNGSGEGGHLEFGCVYVFTCVASCWSDGESYRQETVLLQAEEY